MNEIKKSIDTGLCDMNISPERMVKNIQEGNRNYRSRGVRRFGGAVAAALCLVLFGTAAYAAGTYIYSQIKVNHETMPELEPMEVVPVQEVEGNVTEYGYVEKSYGTIAELEKELGISLLGTELAGNPYMRIDYQKIGDGYHMVNVREYIIGDLIDIRDWDKSENSGELEGNDDKYIWTVGEIYKSPVNLEVEIISDPSQQELDTEYLGYFEYVKTITADQGYTVNILQDSVDENDPVLQEERYRPQVCAIFVSDGVRYTLKGRVPVETMVDIVNSMRYL
ncbi:hypothetical protein ABXS75_07070 [Roseburia hominis]